MPVNRGIGEYASTNGIPWSCKEGKQSLHTSTAGATGWTVLAEKSNIQNGICKYYLLSKKRKYVCV